MDRSPPASKKIPERLNATFLLSAPKLRNCPPEDAPEVAFAGRSNAGKSSVLNAITGNKRMAKVSKTPGRTQLLNFFTLNNGARLVDLPGYGYAKAGKEAQSTWQAAVNDYLSHRDSLVGLVLVMDVRHPNQAYDQELLNWSQASELPIHVLLNKSDKLGYSKQLAAQRALRKAYPDHEYLSIQSFSAMKGTGKSELIDTVSTWIENAPPAPLADETPDSDD